MSAAPLVSVIVAAFDAERTLGETLRSALAQTCRDIEIIVVDDGSGDGTAEIAADFAARDARVRLIRQAQKGVSAARNAGIAAARGEWIAPLDSDDLWHPAKIDRQLEAARAAPETPGFVYTFFRLIDMEGRITGSGGPYAISGRSIHRHLFRNFVGNGSSVLMRREAVAEAGGYAERLDRSEDYLLQLEIAVRHPVAVVPEYLVGYRRTPGSLSSNGPAMFRAWCALLALLPERLPGADLDMIAWPHARRCFDAAEHEFLARRYLACAGLIGRAIVSDPAWMIRYTGYRIARHIRRRRSAPKVEVGPLFLDAPTTGVIARDPYEDLTARLQALEQERFTALKLRDEA
jgi:glycosyltransferase involved in cell wall biosynthesis